MGSDLNVKTECRRIVRLSSSGEHKTSVDSLAALKRKGGGCSNSTSRAVKASKSRLDAADSFVRLAMKQKKDGDLIAARGSLEEALEVYPRYYWVQKLLRGVEKSMIAEMESFISEAHYLESVNDPEAASSRLKQAAMLYPADAEIKSQITRIDRVIAENKARAEAAERRSRVKADIDRAAGELNAARKAEQDGRLDDSAYYISQALIIIPRDVPLQGEIVEYARLIGMRSFSSGRLRQAREVWRLARVADPDNEKLRKYLYEVESRIENLEKIQRSGSSIDIQ